MFKQLTNKEMLPPIQLRALGNYVELSPLEQAPLLG